MIPTPVETAPGGPAWLHEVILGGLRAQVHLEKTDVTVYGLGGNDISRRYPIKDTVAAIPAQSAIIECEIVACDESGQPDFRAPIEGHPSGLCLWCFDLLALDGVRLTDWPLSERRAILNDLINAADDLGLQFSVGSDDAGKLLAAAAKMGLPGILSKRRDSRYRSGRTRNWLKVKAPALAV